MRYIAAIFVVGVFVVCEGTRVRGIVNSGDVGTRVATDKSAAGATACVLLDFRFLELEGLSYDTKVLKYVEVFMDEKAFNEQNLKSMLSYLSTRHAKWKRLVVAVNTNWNQLGTFASEECEGSGASNMPEPSDKYDYYQAVMYRVGKNQFFRYYPKLKSREIKTVVSTGSECWLADECEK